ncbi:MAG: hypothetical protein KAI79_12315 [Bacteroidales bacterium]|nr:hypothetical protein [Bacteroidales bacterium]
MIREALKILEAGEAAGKLELVKTPLATAKTYGEEEFKDNNKDMSKELPDFDVNYEKVKSEAKLGKTQRKDMPVIEIDDVRGMQKKLKAGAIDIKAPHPKDDKLKLANNPFPAGLKGKDAELWLKDGLKPFDGEVKDDIVNVKMGKVAMGDLKPIQKQIYFDKAIQATAGFGAKGTEKFLTTDSIMIVSSDNYIIDGHHRWLSGNLINPKMKSPALIIDLPIDKLLPLAIAYGDAIGNKRNEDESIIKNILEKMNER